MLRATQFPYNLPNRSDATGLSFGRFLFWVRALLGARQIAALTALLLFTGCAPRQAHAQFIGYTAPQTNQQTLASNLACTGSPQNFVVNNFGQISHAAQLISTGVNVQTLQMAVQGSTDGVTFVNISDTLTGNTIGVSGVGVSGFGYFPVVRVQVLCRPVAGGSAFSLSYSGVAGASNAVPGAFSSAVQEKLLFSASPANATTNSGLNPAPFGNSSGLLQFSYSGAGPTGSTVAVVCSQFYSGTLAPLTYTFSLPSTGITASPAIFVIPPGPCPVYTVNYTSGGASAVTFTATYIFTVAGSPPSSSMLYTPSVLGVNAITEPAAGTSALSNIVDTRGARQGTLSFVCTAGNVTLNVQEYAEDGSTTLALVSPLSAVGAAANAQLTFGSESNPSSNVGTLSTSALVRLPQRAMAFSFTNAGGAGTCTARLFLAY